MMFKKLNIFFVILTLAIAGCNKKSDLKLDDTLIKKEPTFDRQEFIDQSKERSKEDYKFGPKIDLETRSKRTLRTLINKEESFNYVDLEELTGENFKISINVENMDIRTFAGLISKATDVNILVSDEVQGTVTAKLNNVLWTSALDSVLKTKQLEKHVDTVSNIIRIHDQNTVVQLEDFERKRNENVQRALLLKKASQPLYTEIFKLYYTKPMLIKQTIESVLTSKGMNAEGIRNINPEITVDERKNLLIVKARKDDIDIISSLVSELDTRTQQVFIEAFIVEVKDGFNQAFGSRFGVNSTDGFSGVNGKSGESIVGGVAGTAGGLALGSNASSLSDLAVTSPTGGIGILTGISNADDLKIELTALEKQGLTKVISNPRIFTLDNEEATIFQGNEVPYETTSDQGTKIEFKEAGLKLAVIPTIIGDGNLMLSVKVNKDTVDTSKANPPISKSEIKSNLVTQDGEIVVMGGIYTESEIKGKDQIPGVGNIPGIGKLFKRDSKDDSRSELIIFVAPKIL